MNFKATAKNPIEYKFDPRSVAVGDFNNDTWLDIVVANNAVNNIAIFLGYGNGTFLTGMTYSTGSDSAPYMVAVGDFNSDHRSDIAVANFGSNSVGIFLGLGDGSFESQIVLSTASSRPLWINIGDFDKGSSIKDVQVKSTFFDPSLPSVQKCPFSADPSLPLDVQFTKKIFKRVCSKILFFL